MAYTEAGIGAKTPTVKQVRKTAALLGSKYDTAEAFDFELEDGTTVTKTIPVISTTTGTAS